MIKQQKYVCDFFSLRVFLYFVFLYPKQTNQKPLLFHKVPFPRSWSSSPDSLARFTFSFSLFSTSAICNMRHCKTSFLIYFLSLNEHKQFNYNQQHYMNTIILSFILHLYTNFPSAHLMTTMERVQHCVLPLVFIMWSSRFPCLIILQPTYDLINEHTVILSTISLLSDIQMDSKRLFLPLFEF